MSMSNIPTPLKGIKVFLARANELDRDRSAEARVMSYVCRQYAVHVGIPLAGQDVPSRECLGMILGQLEKEKDAMSVFSNEEHWQICRKVADKVLNTADAEDRAGRANKLTAKSFYAAATFYEVLQQFYPGEGQEVDDVMGDLITEEERRRIYCKWKATDILNAVKEGRMPTPGGFVGSADEDVVSPFTTMMKTTTTTRLNDLPPPPPLPIAVSDFYEETNLQFTKTVDSPCNASGGGGFELNLDGDATPSSPTEDLEPGNATEEKSSALLAVDKTTLSATSPSQEDHHVRQENKLLPSKSKTRSPSPVATAPRNTSSSNTGLFPSKSSTTTTTILSKKQLADAIELTIFALAALQKGDAEMGRERLEQALSVWGR